jgi:trehalose 6-phosphate phosphatase
MDLLAPLREAPEKAALLFDVDGTIAPIAPRPELAFVPAETKLELARLAARYLLVACISGRSSEEAEALVGVEGIRYVGNHGLELDERAAELTDQKDEEAARAELEEVADRARTEGLDPRWGRKVLEIRPPVAADKGTAVTALLASVPARLALYAGDDTTDLDAFEGLARAGLDRAVRVAVESEEGPAELLAAADLVVVGPAQLASLLATL